MSRSGDWKCRCGNDNFASRDKCRKCDTYKSKAVFVVGGSSKSFGSEKKAGDWNCSCGELNFASRTSCRKCASAKAVDKASAAPQEKRAGDWNCACGELNFGTRIACRKCGTARPGEQKEGVAAAEDDTCIVCMDRQIDTAITLCGHLGYCGICSLAVKRCPVCRVEFDPDKHLLKIYKPR